MCKKGVIQNHTCRRYRVMIYSYNFAFLLQGWLWPIPGVPEEDEKEDDEVTTTSEKTTTSQITVTGSTETTTHFIGKQKQFNIED